MYSNPYSPHQSFQSPSSNQQSQQSQQYQPSPQQQQQQQQHQQQLQQQQSQQYSSGPSLLSSYQSHAPLHTPPIRQQQLPQLPPHQQQQQQQRDDPMTGLLDSRVSTSTSQQDGAGVQKKGAAGGRPRDRIWELYTGDRNLANCLYCAWKTEHPKAFRMRAHTLNCDQVPEDKRRMVELWQETKAADAAAALAAATGPSSATNSSGAGPGATTTSGGVPSGSGSAGGMNKGKQVDKNGADVMNGIDDMLMLTDPVLGGLGGMGGGGGGGGMGSSSSSNPNMNPSRGVTGIPIPIVKPPPKPRAKKEPKMAAKSPISCHVLDSTCGKPAKEVQVRLDVLDTKGSNGFTLMAQGQTDMDGRCVNLLAPGSKIEAGIYKITFFTSDYFTKQGIPSFYPFVEISFDVKVPEEHYHIPLLLSPYSFTTYRGS